MEFEFKLKKIGYTSDTVSQRISTYLGTLFPTLHKKQKCYFRYRCQKLLHFLLF